MNIVKNQKDTTLTINLEGRLDTSTSPQLENELRSSLNGITNLVFDLVKLDYISSAGLRVLLSAHKAMAQKGGMKIVHANEIVNEVFEVTGFADILSVE